MSMKVEKMGRDQEDKIVGIVGDLIGHSKKSASFDPNAEIVKVATSEGFTAPLVSRLAEAFNVARSLVHFKTAEDRTSSFPVADVNVILDTMYPDSFESSEQEVKEARKRDNRVVLSGPLEKAASVPEERMASESGRVSKGAYSELESLQKLAEHARGVKNKLMDYIRADIDKLHTYFRKSASRNIDDVEYEARGYFGEEPVQALFTEVRGKRFPQYGYTKKAGALVVDTSSEPFDIIDSALCTLDTYANMSLMHDALDKLASMYSDNIRGLHKEAFHKEAAPASMGMLGFIGSMMQGISGREAPSQAMRDALSKIDAPRLTSTRRAIDAAMLMHDFMQNDPVLSRLPREELIRAFNDTISVSPALLDSPGTLRAALRENAANRGLGVFDAKSLLESGKSYTDTISRMPDMQLPDYVETLSKKMV